MKKILFIGLILVFSASAALAETSDTPKATPTMPSSPPGALHGAHPMSPPSAVPPAPGKPETKETGSSSMHSSHGGVQGGQGMMGCPMMRGMHQGRMGGGMGMGMMQGMGQNAVRQDPAHVLVMMDVLNAVSRMNALQAKMLAVSNAKGEKNLLKELELERGKIDKMISDYRGMVLGQTK